MVVRLLKAFPVVFLIYIKDKIMELSRGIMGKSDPIETEKDLNMVLALKLTVYMLPPL